MKKSVSLLSNLLLSSALFCGGVAMAQELGSGAILRVPDANAAYCHMKFPAVREDSLSWAHPVFDDGAVHAVDFYGSCDYDPLGIDELRTQRRVIFGGIYGDGE
jgi:hypothetical protein